MHEISDNQSQCRFSKRCWQAAEPSCLLVTLMRHYVCQETNRQVSLSFLPYFWSIRVKAQQVVPAPGAISTRHRSTRRCRIMHFREPSNVRLLRSMQACLDESLKTTMILIVLCLLHIVVRLGAYPVRHGSLLPEKTMYLKMMAQLNFPCQDLAQ